MCQGETALNGWTSVPANAGAIFNEQRLINEPEPFLLEDGKNRSGLEEYCKVYQSLIDDYLRTRNPNPLLMAGPAYQLTLALSSMNNV
jgi:hypothetical protein